MPEHSEWTHCPNCGSDFVAFGAQGSRNVLRVDYSCNRCRHEWRVQVKRASFANWYRIAVDPDGEPVQDEMSDNP
jgi:hypothetical protein